MFMTKAGIKALAALAALWLWPAAGGEWERAQAYWEDLAGATVGTSRYVGEWALWQPDSPAAAVEIERRVVVRRSFSPDWTGAGVGIYLDGKNYWLLDLARRPERLGAGRFAGLHQMHRGAWYSEANLERSNALAAADFAWEYNRPYRLRLRLSPEMIRGEIMADDRTLLWADEYRFTAPAVKTGSPGLYVQYCQAEFAGEPPLVTGPAPVAPVKPCLPVTALPQMGKSPSGGSGFFRTERSADGVWQLVDPAGNYFFALGVDHVNFYKHYCEKLGYSPYHRQVSQLYGGPDNWADLTLRRLKDWGFNTLGADSSEELRHRGLPHTESLALGTAFAASSPLLERGNWTGFPDVFDPGWETFCRTEAQKKCAKWRNDPCLLGYFLDNELEYFGRVGGGSSAGLFGELMRQGPDHSGKRQLIAYLRGRHGSLDKFNLVWQQQLTDWGQLAAMTSLPAVTPEAVAARDGFLDLLGERYFKVAVEAVRAADPNHLILGTRFAGNAPLWAWRAAGKYCDVVSFNKYPVFDLESLDLSALQADILSMHRRTGGRPLMITEWSVLALDAGLPCRHGGGMRVDTQAERAGACRALQTLFLRLPCMVGSNYFMWADEPALGISPAFPEDGNYGLVDRNDRPYVELTEMFAALNPQAADLHGKGNIVFDRRETGPTPPSPVAGKLVFERKPGNGWVAANGVLRFEHDGASGNFADRIYLGDRLLGSYQPMIRQLTADGDNWTWCGQLLPVKVRESKDLLELELTGVGGGDGSAAKFEITHRLKLRPGASNAEIELVRVVNRDRRPLTVKALYVALYAAGKVRPEGHPLLYYCRNGRIADWVTADGLRLGLAAAGPRQYDDTDGQGAWKLYYYLDADGGQHPDGRLQLDPPAELAPGAEFTLKSGNRVYLLASDRNPFEIWMKQKGK